MKCSRVIVIFALLIAFSGRLSAATYYIDKDAGGANDGITWASAWTSFAAINWVMVAQGDRIVISGGTASKTYYETLTVGKSGSSGQPITIEKADEPGHNGAVIIDGQNVRDNAVLISSRNYIVVRGLELTNAIGAGSLRIKDCTDIVAENLSIFVRGHGGVHIEDSSSCVVRKNTIRTPDYNYDVQTDGIYAQFNSHNVYEYNNIIVSNQNPDQHCDCLQMFREDSATVRNNYFEQDNTKTANAQGIYATESAGNFLIYNNVVYCPNTLASVIGLRNLTIGTANYSILNNTVIGRSSNLIRVSGSTPIVKNNIVYKSTSSYAMRFESAVSNFQNIDYNIVFIAGGGDEVYYDPHSSSKSWTEWRAMGAESSGMNVDPRINADGTPLGDSPAINNGNDLSHIFTVDQLGNSRATGMWDIGAYEYGSVPAMYMLAPKKLRIVE